ncbi:MAG: SGNH/GDSL hydrolase family protein [Hyphomonadaceae bacterium]
MKRLSAVLFALALAGCVTQPMASTPAPGWAGSWGASPTLPPAGGRSFENQTVRQAIRLSEGGTAIRIRFTNEYGENPLEIGAATVSLAGEDGKPSGPPVAITFSGASTAVIPPGAPLLSDPIALDAAPLQQLSISLYLPKTTGPCTCHFAGIANAEISGPGDFTRSGFETKETLGNRAFISAVDVQTPAPRTIIAFGDSITDGTSSTSGANRRWPDVLAERLVAAGQQRGVSNQAIAGNRILSQQLPIFGESALARFDRDVLTVPNAGWMVVLEGINDIGMGAAAPPSADDLRAGYRQLIARAHAHGIKVYFATLLPYEGARYFHEAGEAVRQELNAWIRSTDEVDGFIDFDAAMRDAANPRRMKADLQSGDWLHPNDAGYRVMGEAVDLALFR